MRLAVRPAAQRPRTKPRERAPHSPHSTHFSHTFLIPTITLQLWASFLLVWWYLIGELSALEQCFSPAFLGAMDRLLVLLLGWSCVCCGYCAMLKDHFTRLTKDFGHKVDTYQSEKTVQDTVSEHMQMLYSKYTSASFPLRDGNTVRSFKAHPGMCLLQRFFIIRFNLKRDVCMHYCVKL